MTVGAPESPALSARAKLHAYRAAVAACPSTPPPGCRLLIDLAAAEAAFNAFPARERAEADALFFKLHRSRCFPLERCRYARRVA